ncbi:MAG TPA: hypothetical protein PL085_05010 [Agriterribacter sp.]|nr:hypothetical protein [Agriterribacter sp.]
MKMKQRVLTGWNRMRWIYLITGVIIIIQAAISRQWLGIALGNYFTSMAVFRFGCASGTCFGGSCDVHHTKSD